MQYEEYRTFYVESITEIYDKHYILNGFPQQEDKEDYYYEIHIESKNSLPIIKTYIDKYICIEILSLDKLIIYYGQFYQDMCDDGEVSYINYSYRKIEKTSKEWKPKFKDLRNTFDDLLKNRYPFYLDTHNKIVKEYHLIYQQQFDNNSNITKEALRFLTGGNQLIDSYQTHWLYNLIGINKDPLSTKDWRLDYLHLQSEFDNLLKVDLENYQLIKMHIINTYNKNFEHRLPWLKYNFKNIEEQRYIEFFNSIITQLNQANP